MLRLVEILLKSARIVIYYALLAGLLFTMVMPFVEAYQKPDANLANGALFWSLFAQNFLVAAFLFEFLFILVTHQSLLRASIVRIFAYSSNRETDLYYWMYFTAVYFFLPIWISQSPYLKSIFPIYDLGSIAGGLFGFLLLSWVAYAVHWLSHNVPALWELHKIHHSTTELTGITGPREHLFFEIIHIGVFILFFDTSYMLASLVFASRAFLNVLQHSQLSMKFGWLGNFVISPHAHRIHHLKNPKYFNKNFGSDITLWDHLFGTFQYEVPLTAAEMEKDFGLSEQDNPGGEKYVFHELGITTYRSLKVLFRDLISVGSRMSGNYKALSPKLDTLPSSSDHQEAPSAASKIPLNP